MSALPSNPEFEPLADFPHRPPAELTARARRFYEEIARRRTVREFADTPVPRDAIEWALKAAGTAPSGANLQPWHFAVVQSADAKRRIRLAAEEEERAFYSGRAPQEWLDALAPLGTDASKPFLETAPYLIAVFAQKYGLLPDGRRVTHYYVPESVGIATGLLIAALHTAGLATLTHTPSPMGFLNEICGRPKHEKPYLLLVAGYPAADAKTPRFARMKKPLAEFTTWL
ncbi:MAG: nitroreductase family protein [Rhodospirillaceae bacterium]|nr:nitroreductase family protein [Rhodospirillaceae bacterium]